MPELVTPWITGPTLHNTGARSRCSTSPKQRMSNTGQSNVQRDSKLGDFLVNNSEAVEGKPSRRLNAGMA